MFELFLFFFVNVAWPVIENTREFFYNWHIKLLCDLGQLIVENVAQRKKRQFDHIINIPVRALKSSILTKSLNAWAWAGYPHLNFITSSHSFSLGVPHAVETRDIIMSDEYQKLFGHVFKLKDDQNNKSHFKNNKGGQRFVTSVDSKNVLGHGADIIIADDLNPGFIHSRPSPDELDKAFQHYKLLGTRINDPDVSTKLLIQQRIDVNDVTGQIMRDEALKSRHRLLCITAEENDVTTKNLLKYYKDSLYDPKRFSLETLNQFRSLNYSAMFQQKPVPAGGETVKAEWFRFYNEIPKNFDNVIMSLDASVSEGINNSYSVCQVWGKKDHNVYLIHQYRRQIGIVELLKVFNSLSLQFPQAYDKLVENKANGAPLIQMLEDKIPGIVKINPTGSKDSRLDAVANVIASGVVYLPNPNKESWVSSLIEEVCHGASGFDDQKDALSQALQHLFPTQKNFYDQLLDEVLNEKRNN